MLKEWRWKWYVKCVTSKFNLFIKKIYILVNVEEWLADIGDLSVELQRSSSTSSLTAEGNTINAMTSDYDSEDYGEGQSESPIPMDQAQSSSQDEEERPDSVGMDKDWGMCKKSIIHEV